MKVAECYAVVGEEPISRDSGGMLRDLTPTTCATSRNDADDDDDDKSPPTTRRTQFDKASTPQWAARSLRGPSTPESAARGKTNENEDKDEDAGEAEDQGEEAKADDDDGDNLAATGDDLAATGDDPAATGASTRRRRMQLETIVLRRIGRSKLRMRSSRITLRRLELQMYEELNCRALATNGA